MCTLREPEKKFADGGEGIPAPPPGVANEEGFFLEPEAEARDRHTADADERIRERRIFSGRGIVAWVITCV